MALFNCSYRLIDDKGKRQSFIVPVPRGVLTIADITGFMAAQAVLVDNITECLVESMAIEIGVAVPGALKDAAVANSDAEEGGNFSFGVASSGYSFGVRVPGLIQGMFVGSDIDLANAAIEAFTDSMVAGLLVGAVTVSPSNPFELDLISILSGSKSFRK